MLTLCFQQYLLLIISMFLFLFSILFHQIQKENFALALLLLGAFGIRMFMITLDPFLHDWDERFHALVAKNMMNNPFAPLLHVNPIMSYDYRQWCCNHIWLHKQPLFLWQMAVSMKVFGVNTMAFRLPDVILGSIEVVFVYRVGKLLQSASVGFFGALFFALSYYQLELTAGVEQMDHSRVAFAFYVTASVWALAEYFYTRKKIWIIFIGIFAGLAVLNLWLAGLIVYAGWVVSWLVSLKFNLKNFWKEKNELLWMIISIAVAVAVFLPWQLYVNRHFPREATFEMQYNQRHITEVLDEHSGAWYYYLRQTPLLFGIIGWVFIPLGIYFTWRNSTNRKLLATLFAIVTVCYLFFSFIVKTKMQSYVFMVSPIIFISFGSVIANSTQKNFKTKITGEKRNLVLVSLLTTFSVEFVLRLPEILSNKLFNVQAKGDRSYRERKIHNTATYKKIDQLVPKDFIVFNVPSFEDSEAMFFSSHEVYSWYPSQEEFESLKQRGINMAMFESHGNYLLPSYIVVDPSVKIVQEVLE